MAKHNMPEAHTAHPNVVPLIDVVMCLIIFFMLAAKIGVSTGAEEMKNLPKAILGKDIEDMGNTITLNVRDVGPAEPMVTTLVDGQTREVKFQENRGGRVVRPLFEILKAGSDVNSEFKVIIRSPEDTPIEKLEPVLFAAAEAKAKNVNFATMTVTGVK